MVVDDCSTDSSCDIIKSYAEKFGGQLTLLHTQENSGGGGAPRNKGLEFSRGEYVFFMDADDILTRTGLEEMYTLAKEFDADTVYCEKYFMSSGIGQDFVKNIHIADSRIQKVPPVDKPVLETNDMVKRINKAIMYAYWVTPWLRLVSRNLLIENNIKYPSLIGSNDVGWTFKVLFCSKRFLRIPNPCYVWRMYDESTTFRERSTPQHVHKWMDRTIRSLKDMDEFMSGLTFFRENPVYRYVVCNSFLQKDFYNALKKCINDSPFDVYNIFREKFGKYLGEHDVLVSVLCAALYTQQKINTVNAQQFQQFAAKAKARIAQLEAELKRRQI